MNAQQNEGALWIGMKIRSLRKEHRYTRSALAKALDITPTHLYRIETGRRMARLPLLQKLGEFFEVPLSYFLADEATSRTQQIGNSVDNELPADIREWLEKENARPWLEVTREAAQLGLRPEDMKTVLQMFCTAKKRWEDEQRD